MLEVDEAGHDDLAGVGADAGGGGAGGEQGDGEGERGGAADEVAEAGVGPLDRVHVGVAGQVVEELGGDGEHGHVDRGRRG